MRNEFGQRLSLGLAVAALAQVGLFGDRMSEARATASPPPAAEALGSAQPLLAWRTLRQGRSDVSTGAPGPVAFTPSMWGIIEPVIVSADRKAPPSSPTFSVKVADRGGNIYAYSNEVSRLNRMAAVKVISGVCASACTMYLGVSRACVEPNAQLWFHAAHLPGDHRPDAFGSLKMLSHYPRRIRAWAIQVGALENTDWDRAKVLTSQQLVALGIPKCRP